jgi:Ca-activated chloride channel homolog
MISFSRPLLMAAAFCLVICVCGLGQSGRTNQNVSSEGAVISVVAVREDKKAEPIRLANLFLYENGIEQKIKNFSADPSPSRIVLLVDNSQTLPTSVEKMKAVAMEFAYEIFEGDELFVIAYDEKPEIIQEWTGDAKKLEASFATFRKKGNPHLFDALSTTVKEVVLPLMPGTRKTAVVIIGDGLDRGSKTPFETVVSDLQSHDVTVYALQLPDRTGGAYRRDQPKASNVISGLVEQTGGLSFPFDQAQAAAKAICDELRKNRFLLSYQPANVSSFDARRIFLMGDEGIKLRTKAAHPPNIR